MTPVARRCLVEIVEQYQNDGSPPLNESAMWQPEDNEVGAAEELRGQGMIARFTTAWYRLTPLGLAAGQQLRAWNAARRPAGVVHKRPIR